MVTDSAQPRFSPLPQELQENDEHSNNNGDEKVPLSTPSTDVTSSPFHRPHLEPPTVIQSLKVIATLTWLNVLLLFIVSLSHVVPITFSRHTNC